MENSPVDGLGIILNWDCSVKSNVEEVPISLLD